MPTPVVEGDDTAVVVDALVVLSTSALTSNAQRVAGAPGVPAVDDAVSIDVEPPAVKNVAASTTHAIVAASAGPVEDATMDDAAGPSITPSSIHPTVVAASDIAWKDVGPLPSTVATTSTPDDAADATAAADSTATEATSGAARPSPTSSSVGSVPSSSAS